MRLSTAARRADVLSGRKRRAIRISASCYRVPGAVLSDSINRPRIAGFPSHSCSGGGSNSLTLKYNPFNAYACGGF